MNLISNLDFIPFSRNPVQAQEEFCWQVVRGRFYWEQTALDELAWVWEFCSCVVCRAVKVVKDTLSHTLPEQRLANQVVQE